MVGWGVFLIIIGAGSLLLPLVGFQFSLMELVDDFQPFAGIVVAIIGAAMVLLGMNRGASDAVATSAAAPANDPAAAEPAPASEPIQGDSHDVPAGQGDSEVPPPDR